MSGRGTTRFHLIWLGLGLGLGLWIEFGVLGLNGYGQILQVSGRAGWQLD